MKTIKILLPVLLAAGICSAERDEQDLAAADLGEIDRRLNNPLTFQNNTAINNKGYAVENSLSKNFLSRRV